MYPILWMVFEREVLRILYLGRCLACLIACRFGCAHISAEKKSEARPSHQVKQDKTAVIVSKSRATWDGRETGGEVRRNQGTSSVYIAPRLNSFKFEPQRLPKKGMLSSE